jgi:hypothetical protein
MSATAASYQPAGHGLLGSTVNVNPACAAPVAAADAMAPAIIAARCDLR